MLPTGTKLMPSTGSMKHIQTVACFFGHFFIIFNFDYATFFLMSSFYGVLLNIAAGHTFKHKKYEVGPVWQACRGLRANKWRGSWATWVWIWGHSLDWRWSRSWAHCTKTWNGSSVGQWTASIDEVDPGQFLGLDMGVFSGEVGPGLLEEHVADNWRGSCGNMANLSSFLSVSVPYKYNWLEWLHHLPGRIQ